MCRPWAPPTQVPAGLKRDPATAATSTATANELAKPVRLEVRQNKARARSASISQILGNTPGSPAVGADR